MQPSMEQTQPKAATTSHKIFPYKEKKKFVKAALEI